MTSVTEKKGWSDHFIAWVFEHPVLFLGTPGLCLMLLGWRLPTEDLFDTGLSIVWLVAIIFGSIRFMQIPVCRRFGERNPGVTVILLAAVVLVTLLELLMPLPGYLWGKEWCGLACVFAGG